MRNWSNRTHVIVWLTCGAIVLVFFAVGNRQSDGTVQGDAQQQESSCVEPDDTALGELIRALEVSGNEPWMPWAQSSDGATYWLAATLRDKPGLVVVVSAPIGTSGQQVAVNGTAKAFTDLPKGKGMPQEATTALDCVTNGGA
jgi:hypothetical protein